MAVLTNTEYLRGDYSDRDIIDLLNEPKVKEFLKEAGVETIGQWKAVGKKLKSVLRNYTINEGALKSNIMIWGTQFRKGMNHDELSGEQQSVPTQQQIHTKKT